MTSLPLMVPANERSLVDLVRTDRGAIAETLLRHGAILFRGFEVASTESFRRVALAACEQLVNYVYRSTPRQSLDDLIFTASEYRATDRIAMHNENAFQRDWPMRLLFCCLRAADEGGQTPLISTTRVTQRIGPDLIRTFAEHGVMYVRNYWEGVDLPWQVVFQTDSKAEVEAYCAQQSIRCEWIADRLRTTQVCQAVARHPVTGDVLWFNQAHLFHVSGMGSERAAALRSAFAVAELPRHAYLGDGSEIDDGIVARIREAYDTERSLVEWRAGDVLLLDNMLVAHGREPFVGPRQIAVAMGDPFSAALRGVQI